MAIPLYLTNFIIRHGYLGLFSLIFMQELGVPLPVPNEISLLFAGYLASTGALSFPLIFLSGVAADFIGTSMLYAVFYFFGKELIEHAPRWFPKEKIEKFKQRIAKKGSWGVFGGRLLPYVRGYTSVAAGLLRIPPKRFLFSVLASAAIWSGGYVIAGRIMGKEWQKIATHLSPLRLLIIGAILLIVIFFIIPRVLKHLKQLNSKLKDISQNDKTRE